MSIIHHCLVMDEGVKRMEEGNNLPLDDDAKNEVLKKQETTNINGDSDIKQQIAEQDDQQPVLLVKQKTKRVATLDAFRGLTIVVSLCNPIPNLLILNIFFACIVYNNIDYMNMQRE